MTAAVASRRPHRPARQPFRHRSLVPGGRRRAGRLRELMLSGLADSFGLALGWTVFNLIAARQGGLSLAGLFSASMLIGVVLSAPVTGWLARRLHGRKLLALAASSEAVLRVLTLAALLTGVNRWIVAAGVVVMHIAAFSGFAAMRAEVAAVDTRPQAMTRYALTIAAIEAAGACVAALLPLHGATFVLIFGVYGLSLLPTVLSSRRARVHDSATRAAAQQPAPRTRAGRARNTARLKLPWTVFAGGGTVSLLAAGPTLLSVALASELHGQAAVAGAAASFSAGCLLSSSAVTAVARLRMPPQVIWPLWGVGMLAGWLLAPTYLAGLFAAQFLSGLCMTAFEGSMDARIARQAEGGTVTTVLAWSASMRAMGGAIAVRVIPALVAAPAIGLTSGVAMATLGAFAASALLRTVTSRSRVRTA